MDASEKILELRDIVKEIADHKSAISDLERRMRKVLELDAGSRLDPRRRSTVDQKRRMMAAACSGR